MTQDNRNKPAKGNVIVGDELELLGEIKDQLTEIRRENAHSGRAKRIIAIGVATGLITWAVIQITPILYEKLGFVLAW